MSIKSRWLLAALVCASASSISTVATAQTPLNLAPNCQGATVTPLIIDPADDRMQPLSIQVQDPDGNAVTITTQCIQQSEPAVHYSDGSAISGDGAGIGTAVPKVRAKRITNFILTNTNQYYRTNGRLYDVIFKAQDSLGAACVGKVTVEAPLYLGSYQNPDASTKDFGFRFPSAQNLTNCAATAFNNPPIIYSTPPTSVRAGNTLEYQIQGHDPDSQTLKYYLVSGPATIQVNEQSGLFVWTPSQSDVGDKSIMVKVVDTGGLEALQTFNINVQSAVTETFDLAIVANPVSGLSPLTVRFSPLVRNANLVIADYRWDFDSNGTIDHSDRFGAPVTRTYTGAPGTTFTATLTVILGEGSQDPAQRPQISATKVISIANQNPSVTVSATATNGHAPLSVQFTVAAQDPQGIATVEIDFDGDGAYDQSTQFASVTPVTTNFSTAYETEGVFVPVVRVTDAAGGVTIASNNAINVDVNNPLDPIITLGASPAEGPTPLTATLTATASIFDESSVASWSWDVDGDGVFETAGGSGATDSLSQTYSGLNSYYPTVKVVTVSGREAIASTRVRTTSSAKPTLSIPNTSDTINLDALEMSTFTINLPYQTKLNVVIENAAGDLIKTLASEQLLNSGSHSFVWDGSNDQDEFVKEGDYYVVLSYEANGELAEIDLRGSTGGVLSYYTRTTTNPTTFNRLERPIPIQYAVADPAQVTFFWQVSFGDRLMTLLEHERMGRGTYSLMWNGEYPNGKKIASNVINLMPGILRYTLPDNVIFVKEDPRILDYKLQSTIIADPRREPIGILLSVSKDSDIEIVVSDMEKGVDVANRYFEDVTAGEQKLYWDGKNNEDQLLAPGDYRIGVRSIDDRGGRSLFWYRTQRIDY